MLTSICYHPKREEESVEDEAGEDLRTGKESRIESVVSKNLDGYMGRDIAECRCRVTSYELPFNRSMHSIILCHHTVFM